MKKYLYKLSAPSFIGLFALAGNVLAQGLFPWNSPGLEGSDITDLAGGIAEFLFIKPL